MTPAGVTNATGETTLRTMVPFTLPIGYRDDAGQLHQDGEMRLATAGDEILPLRDPRVQANPAYLAIIVLSRVVTRLGDLDVITPKIIEDMFAADLGHLQVLYDEVNGSAERAPTVTCPRCEHQFQTDAEPPGKSISTPPTASSTS